MMLFLLLFWLFGHPWPGQHEAYASQMPEAVMQITGFGGQG